MRFEDTGLKKDKLVEDAFNYAQDYNKALAPEMLSDMKDRLSALHDDQLLRPRHRHWSRSTRHTQL
jgi:hypothetical protein